MCLINEILFLFCCRWKRKEGWSD